MKLKKDTLIVIFYIFYFSWLFTLTYLSTDTLINNYFTLFVVVFYFIFLREEWDIVWFIVASSVAIIARNSLFSEIYGVDYKSFESIPFWLPLAWGTTILALRKFFILISKR